MKLLIVISSLDLTEAFSATPAWWQLLKALYEIGVEVIVSPYQGAAIESLWWRAAPNPAKFAGDSFKFARDTLRRFKPPKPTQTVSQEEQGERLSDKAVRELAQRLIAPLWERHLDRILTKETDIDAVLFVTIPLNQVAGIARSIREKHDKPVFFFDGDVPASLPIMTGFQSGFRIYQGADLSEYTAFISNSLGGEIYLHAMGAVNTHTLWYGADETVYAPLNPAPQQDVDVFFFGHGREYREFWVDAMLTQPSLALPEQHFAVRGKNLGELGHTHSLPYLSFSKLREYVCRSKINLVITRGAHASVYGSSSSRPFELGAMGAAMVANPYKGLELWYEPEKEIIIIESAEEALDRYCYLLSHDSERQKMGQAARERVLKQHTFRHRAHELVRILRGYL